MSIKENLVLFLLAIIYRSKYRRKGQSFYNIINIFLKILKFDGVKFNGLKFIFFFFSKLPAD